MAEYIERELLKRQIIGELERRWGVEREAAVKLIDSVLTADVAPVAHAHWTQKRLVNTANCSRCGRVHESKMREHNPEYSRNFNDCDAFCPNCGAKMDEVISE